MSDKYFFGKCGGEDCMFRTGVILGEHQCLKDIEKCSKERCQNCPHGKTMEEMAEVMKGGTDDIPKSMSDTTVKNGVHSIIVKMETIFIYGLKALLGEEEK